MNTYLLDTLLQGEPSGMLLLAALGGSTAYVGVMALIVVLLGRRA